MARGFLVMSAEECGGTSHTQGFSAVGRVDLEASANLGLHEVEQTEVIKSGC